MAMLPLKIRPGVNTQQTPTDAGAQWVFTQNARFRDGLLQKLGGWAKAAATQFTGICRGLHSWTQINGLLNMGVGTHLKLWLFQLGAFFDLTPVRASGTLGNNPFTTTNLSNVVTVASTAHGLSVGDIIELAGATTFNNVTMNGEFVVQTIVDANDYTILASTNANAGGAGGGNAVTFQYLLPVGSQDNQFLLGFGAGPFGSGGFGQSSGSSYALLCRLWFIDNWGEFMLASPQNLGIYQWMPSSGTGTRATTLTNAPAFNAAIFVSAATQQVISLGSTTGGVQDPMLVAFSDVGSNTTWTAAATNQAGSFRLSRGSKIMNGLGSALTNLIWTNEGLWLMQYIGPPLVYAFNQVGFGCGLIAPKAVASTPSGIFWMEESANFFMYDGTVKPLECMVRDKLFGNINMAQSNKIFAALNSQFNEVTWFYPSLNSIEIDSSVTYNYAENLWHFNPPGALVRTAWEDHENFQYPMAAGFDRFLYNQELGVDADGTPMMMSAQTGYLGDGDYFNFLERLLPDSGKCAGPYSLSVLAVDIDASADRINTYGPLPVIPGTTPHVIVRARNRVFALQIQSGVLGGNYRQGDIRARMKPAGKRR